MRTRLWIATLAILLGVGAAVSAGADATHPMSAAGIDPSCTLSGPCIEYDNNGAGPGVKSGSFLGTGLIGFTRSNSTSGSNGTAGVLGSDASTSGAFDFGVRGTSVRGTGVFGASTNGVGVSGTSTGGYGIVGVTKFNSTASSNGKAGVFGNDLSASGFFDSGVLGNSQHGIGVLGASVQGDGVVGRAGSPSNIGVSNNSGVYGDSAFQYGVAATSLNNNALFAQSYNNIGAVITSLTADGTLSSTQNVSSVSGVGHAGIVGDDISSDGGQLNSGVLGFSTYGIGIRATSTNFVGANIIGGALPDVQYPALSVIGNSTGSLIAACPPGPAVCNTGFTLSPAVFAVYRNGSVNIANILYTGGSCSNGCARTNGSGERRVRFFTPQESLPTVEDFGEAQLVDGQAYVRIDPAFANTVDPQTNYLVFITPEGDSRGLFVTAKTLRGFAVRENEGGRSTLAFSYRIVAKPFGQHPARLQMFAMEKPGTPPVPKSNTSHFRP